MPRTKTQSNSINAKRFAGLLAGFDTGNTSEEEAMSKGQALRRMAVDTNMRIVDVLELPEIREAIDEQMQPRRQETPALQKALHEIEVLRGELTDRTRDVRRLAETLAIVRHQKNSGPHAVTSEGAAQFIPGAQSWVYEVGVTALAVTLMLMAFFQ